MKSDQEEAARILLSDDFNDDTEQKSMGLVGERTWDQAQYVTRPRSINMDLMQFRSENPFIPVRELGDNPLSYTLSNSDEQVRVDVPNSAKAVTISAGNAGANVTQSAKSLVLSFDGFVSDVTVTPGLIGDGRSCIIVPVGEKITLWCLGKRTAYFTHQGTGVCLFSVGFHF